MSEWGGEPAYVRVLNDLRKKIESGQLAPGEVIPSVSELSRTHQVAGTTVQKALRALKAAGLVDSEVGKRTVVRETKRLISRSGDFVSPVPPGAKTPHGPSGTPEVAQVVPPDDVAEKLGIDPDAPAIRRSRIMVDGETPLEIATSYIPLDIAEGTALAQPGKLKGAVPTVLKQLGFPPRTCREWVESRLPTSSEAKTLKLKPGTPVFRLLRLTSTDGDRPAEVLEVVFSAGRYMLEYDLPIHDS